MLGPLRKGSRAKGGGAKKEKGSARARRLIRTNGARGRGQLAVRTPGILVGCPNIGNKGGKRREQEGGREKGSARGSRN